MRRWLVVLAVVVPLAGCGGHAVRRQPIERPPVRVDRAALDRYAAEVAALRARSRRAFAALPHADAGDVEAFAASLISRATLHARFARQLDALTPPAAVATEHAAYVDAARAAADAYRAAGEAGLKGEVSPVTLKLLLDRTTASDGATAQAALHLAGRLGR